jgi:flagellar basal-body rod modification protein FlgD
MSTVIQGPIGPAQPTPPTTTQAGKGKSALGKDDFLRLLVTQLQHQDPMSPQDPTQFSAQLAQFSSLESMQNIEKVLQSQVDAGGMTTLAMKADLGASFIGRNVIAAGNKLQVTAGGPAPKVTVDIGTGGGKTSLTIYDASGKEIATRDLGWQDAGRRTLDAGSLPAGTYSYKVTVTGAAGSDVPVQTYTSGIVDGVSFQNGTVILRSGDLNFPLDNVVEVERAPAGASILAAITGARVLPSTTESVQP